MGTTEGKLAVRMPESSKQHSRELDVPAEGMEVVEKLSRQSQFVAMGGKGQGLRSGYGTTASTGTVIGIRVSAEIH